MDARAVVGRNLARIRQAKGLTQEHVYGEAGISQHFLSTLESGKRNPSIVTLLRISKVLQVSILELLSGLDDLPMPILPLENKPATAQRSRRRTESK